MLPGSYVIASNAPLVCDSLSRNELPCLLPPVRIFFERGNNAAVDEVRVRYGFRRGAECAINSKFYLAAVFNAEIDIGGNRQIEPKIMGYINYNSKVLMILVIQIPACRSRIC